MCNCRKKSKAAPRTVVKKPSNSTNVTSVLINKAGGRMGRRIITRTIK